MSKGLLAAAAAILVACAPVRVCDAQLAGARSIAVHPLSAVLGKATVVVGDLPGPMSRSRRAICYSASAIVGGVIGGVAGYTIYNRSVEVDDTYTGIRDNHVQVRALFATIGAIVGAAVGIEGAHLARC